MCRGKTEYDNFMGTGYAQVAISTKVRSLRTCLSALSSQMIIDIMRGLSWSSSPPPVHWHCCRPSRLVTASPSQGLVQDVYKTAEQIRASGGKITKEPGPLPGLGTKIMATTDPDGMLACLILQPPRWISLACFVAIFFFTCMSATFCLWWSLTVATKD